MCNLNVTALVIEQPNYCFFLSYSVWVLNMHFMVIILQLKYLVFFLMLFHPHTKHGGNVFLSFSTHLIQPSRVHRLNCKILFKKSQDHVHFLLRVKVDFDTLLNGRRTKYTAWIYLDRIVVCYT